MTDSGRNIGEFKAGDLIGGTYEVLGFIGRGAMGNLYHVRHAMLKGEYALKTLSGEEVTDLDWKRFQAETQATATMSHPNVVSVHNCGLHDKKLPFYVMDLLRGRDLGQKVRKDGPLGLNEAVRIFIEVCAGIGYAHKKGIIHRDIKPANIFLLNKPDVSGATVKVVDFGVAKQTFVKNQDLQSLTGVGNVVGTPYYMSPEQTMAERVDARSDVYSLGCTLFEALTGVVPFRGRNPTEIMILHQNEAPPTLKKASGGVEFPASIEQIMEIVLRKEPAERYQSMEQFSTALSAVLKPNLAVSIAPGGPPIQILQREPQAEAGTSTISSAEYEIDTASAKKKLMLTIVAPTVAGIIALGGMGYWHFSHSPKKTKPLPLDEQLKRFVPKAAVKTPEELAAEKREFEKETAELEQAPSEVTPIDTKPFSVFKNIDGKDKRVFNFPPDVLIGCLREGEQSKWVPAKGEVLFPKNAQVWYMPNAPVAQVSELLKRFQPGDIFGIELGPDTGLEVFRAIGYVPGVQQLDCKKTNGLKILSPIVLSHFTDMKKFTSPMNEADGRELAQAKCWDKIEEVYIQKAKRITPFIQVLHGCKNLKRLGLGPCDLAYADYKTISTMTKLEDLEVTKNPMSSHELAQLTSLDHVADLDITNTNVDIAALDALKKFKSLRRLFISSPKLRTGDIEKIKRELPKVKVLDHIE